MAERHDTANRATWTDRFSSLPTAWRSLILLSPAFALIGAFGLAPLGLILVYSFLVPGTYGGVVWEFSLGAYIQFLFERDIFDGTLAFHTSYLQIGARSVVLAGVAVVGCLLIGFPTAYFIATRPPGLRNILIFLVTVPFWTNLLVRTFSMMLLLRDQGSLNSVLRASASPSNLSRCCTPTSRSVSACSTVSFPSWFCRSTPAWNESISGSWRLPMTFTPTAGKCCNAF